MTQAKSLSDPSRWVMMVGPDGFTHHFPEDEAHSPHVGCACIPRQHNEYSGKVLFVHRILSC